MDSTGNIQFGATCCERKLASLQSSQGKNIVVSRHSPPIPFAVWCLVGKARHHFCSMQAKTTETKSLTLMHHSLMQSSEIVFTSKGSSWNDNKKIWGVGIVTIHYTVTIHTVQNASHPWAYVCVCLCTRLHPVGRMHKQVMFIIYVIAHVGWHCFNLNDCFTLTLF